MVVFKEDMGFKNYAGFPFSVVTNGVESFGFFSALECFIRSIPGAFLNTGDMGDCIIGIRLHVRIADAIAAKTERVEFDSSEYDWLKLKLMQCGPLVFALGAKNVSDAVDKAGENGIS